MTTDLPFGSFDLDPQVCVDPGPPLRVRCYVGGCDKMLRPPSRRDAGETCPVHKIRCHKSATYTYPDPRRNIIASPEIFARRIIPHEFKFESWRMGNERSEDALTWNVFRSFQEAGCLHLVAQWVTGIRFDEEPNLYLWGIAIDDDQFEPWDLLIAARNRFERKLPVKRPATEPDIALHLPGRYVILIEAKFTSSNPFYTDGPRKNNQSLTKDELIGIYSDLTLSILDRDLARASERIYPQLWRNLVFAEWMAMLEGKGTKAYHVSLTRAFWENESCDEFARLLRPGFEDRFTHLRWEDVFVLSGLAWKELATLQQYLLTKTAGLVPAFNIGLF
jgi:hypothetical protein